MIRTLKNNIIEQCYLEKGKLKLLGTNHLNKYYTTHKKFNPAFCEKDNYFSTHLSDGDSFFYNLRHLHLGQVVYSEFGIAKFQDDCISREYTLYGICFKDNTSILDRPKKYIAKIREENEILEVSCYLPSTLFEFLHSPNSITISNKEGIPSPLIIEQNSFIGREDGEIKSIPANSIDALSSISSFTKSIKLKAHKLFCSILETKTLVLKKISKPKRPIIGSLIIDSEDGLMKFYNGKQWRVIDFHEDT